MASPAGSCNVRVVQPRWTGSPPCGFAQRDVHRARVASRKISAKIVSPSAANSRVLEPSKNSTYPAMKTIRLAPTASTTGGPHLPSGAVASTSGPLYGGGRPTEVDAMAKAGSDRSGVLGFLTRRRCWACRERYSRRLPNCPHCKAKPGERPGFGSAASGFAPMPPAGEARRPGPQKGER
jgi:hypothetical protein